MPIAFKQKAGQSQKAIVQDHERRFCLRHFFITFILFSSATVNEKIDVIYDLFDIADGEPDGLRASTIFEIV